jgi:hypothetical protein
MNLSYNFLNNPIITNLNKDGNFNELTPDEWWNKKYFLTQRRSLNNFGHNPFRESFGYNLEQQNLDDSDNYFVTDYSSPNKNYINEINKWKKMSNLEKYNTLKNSKLQFPLYTNKFKPTLKNQLFGELKKLALDEKNQKTIKKVIQKEKKSTEVKVEKKKEVKVRKKRKKAIPKSVKIAVWNKNIGETIGKHKCMCCNVADITQMNFHCGHIIAEAKGGKVHVDNLLPICSKCNRSMGTQNLNEFKKKYFEV